MIVEVVAVGTELLLGQIVNTNAAEIGTALAEDGIDVHYQVTVGDNLARLVATIEAACDRADAVILTGGIGPTQDDLTREALCAVLGAELTRDETHAEAIRARLAARGIAADTALRMADYPAGAEPVPNRTGAALGISAIVSETPVFAVPGVPSEMRVMLDEQVRPRLRARAGGPAVLASRVLRCWGTGEARIAELLDELYASANPSLAFLIDGAEVIVRITAKAESAEAAGALIAETESAVRSRLGPVVFGADDDTVEALVLTRLAERRWTVATVEYASAGELAARLAGSRPFAGGLVVRRGTTPDRSIDADVVVTVGPPGDHVSVAIETPDGTISTTLDGAGPDERARRLLVAGSLHLLRQTLGA